MNNMYNNYGGFNPGGYVYPTQQPVNMTQPLSAEEMKQLEQKDDKFSLALTPMELLKAKCTHKKNNSIATQQLADGKFYCTVCHETFDLIDVPESEIEESVNLIIDILQNIKTYYLSIPREVVEQFFTIIPLLKKVPKLWSIAQNDFHRYEAGNTMGVPGSDVRSFSMLNMLTSPVMPQQPYMGMQQPAPVMGQQPYMGMPGVNPFGGYYAQPQAPQQMPVQQPAPVMGQQPVPAAAPAATEATPATGAPVQTSKVLNV